MKSLVTKLLGVILLVAVVLFLANGNPVSAYAPNIKGSIVGNTGAPITGIWVEWESQEEGNNDNAVNKGTFYRYAQSDDNGKFMYQGWDSEGIVTEKKIKYSVLGKKEYEQKINLDYDESNGNEARRATNNRWNIFNCNNEMNSFSLRLPEQLKGAKVQVRWRRDSNNTAWSAWVDNKVALPKKQFTNNHNYEIQFRIELPKNASIRDIDKDLDPASVTNLNSNVAKVPACIKVELCTGEKNSACSKDYKLTEGKHRVALSAIGDTGIGDAKRKLTSNNKPIWLVECIQEGTAAAPSYTCTTGNSGFDNKIFGQDNASMLRNRYGYSSKIFYTDGTETVAEITDANKQDVYEWETTINPEIARQQKVASIFLAMYEKEGTAPPQSGSQTSQKQATLSHAEGCRLVIDPYGKVYDNYTMEPLSGSTVTLLKQRSSNQFTKVEKNEAVGNLVNPQTTDKSGNYQFIVAAGTYKVEAAKQGYLMATKPNALAAKFYPATANGNEIVVTKEPVRADIALEPQDKEQALAYANANDIIIEHYFQTTDGSKKVQYFDGYVSHPGATITVYGKKAGSSQKMVRASKLASAVADSSGHFTVTVPLSKLQSGEIVGELEATKAQIPGLTLSQKPGIIAINSATNSLETIAQTTSDDGIVYAYAPSSSNVMGEQTAAIIKIDDESTTSLDENMVPSNNQGKPGTIRIIVAMVLIAFVFAATTLLSIYLHNEARRKKRSR